MVRLLGLHCFVMFAMIIILFWKNCNVFTLLVQMYLALNCHPLLSHLILLLLKKKYRNVFLCCNVLHSAAMFCTVLSSYKSISPWIIIAALTPDTAALKMYCNELLCLKGEIMLFCNTAQCFARFTSVEFFILCANLSRPELSSLVSHLILQDTVTVCVFVQPI